MTDGHLRQNIIESHESLESHLGRFANRAFTEWMNSKRPGRWVVAFDPEMGAIVAKLLAKLRKPLNI